MKPFRSVISFVMAFCLLCSVALPTFAQTAYDVVFTMDQAESYNQGDFIQLSVTMPENLPPISSLEMVFSFDSHYLALVRSPDTDCYFDFGKGAKGFLSIGSETTNMVALVGLDMVLKPGVLVTLNLEVVNQIPAEEWVEVSAVVNTATDPENNPVSVGCTPGGVLGKELPKEPEPPVDPPATTPTDTPTDLPTTTPTDIPAREPLHYGDVNSDQKIDAKDALMILKYLVDKGDLTPDQRILSEVSADGGITAKDALLILRYAVEKIKEFPITAQTPIE